MGWSNVPESPPCVWGVQLAVPAHGAVERITPMSMGSTVNHREFNCIHWNHPHVYGEYTLLSYGRNLLTESPPCVWGVPSSNTSPVNVCENHPHVYGEYRLPSALRPAV